MTSVRIEFHQTIDSTQRRARELVERGDRRWDAVCAAHQTAGRGRQGASWHDAPGQSLLTSIILWNTPVPEPVGLVGLLAALATAQVLEQRYPKLPRVQLKYPNDLVVHNRKLGGILAEIVDGVPIVGIGVNLRQTAFPPELEGIALSVAQAIGNSPAPPLLSRSGEEADSPPPLDGQTVQGEAEHLIERIHANLTELWRLQPQQTHALWQARDCSAGRAYIIQDLPQQPIGIAIGIDEAFRLRLRLPDGTEHSTYYVSAV
ncbi:MAG: biotin--[acetyl-CoA-carboxylase] ligase [Armatimonadetes bacterium]|nr:MAG: biotin--[acetyl-CoA-carboxylase] ligase [Armatimonadota bacterium]